MLNNSQDVQNQVVNTDLFGVEQNATSALSSSFYINDPAVNGIKKTFKPKIVVQNEPAMRNKNRMRCNTSRLKKDRLEA